MKALGLLFASFVLLQNAQPVELGTIQGTVTRTNSKEPVPNAEVMLEGGVLNEQGLQSLLKAAANAGLSITPPPGASVSEINEMLVKNAAERGLPIAATTIQNFVNQAAGGRKWPTTTADREGHFTFKDVAPGRYTLRVTRDGYFGKPSNGTYPASAAADVTVKGKDTSEVTISMFQGAVISGRVFDSNGQPAANVNVQALVSGYANGFAQLQATVSKASDDRGEYRLLWVPPGEYYIGGTSRVGALAGTSATLKSFYPGVTRINDAMPVVIRGGEDLRGIDIGMQTPRGFKISGKVTVTVPPPTAAGAAIPNVSLLLVTRDLDAPDDFGVRTLGGFPQNQGTATFEVSSIPPGSYELFGRIPDPTGSGLTGFSWGHVPLEVRDADVSGVSLNVASGVDVKGSVRGVSGARIPSNLRIVLLAADGPSKIPLYRLVSTRGSLVEADGSFIAPMIPPGRYRLGAVSGLPQDFYIADVRQGGVSVFDTGFDVGSRPPDPIEITIGAGAGTVEGTVQAGATVALVPESKRIENRALYASATADAAGRFVFRGVAPGDYQLLAWESTPPNAYMNAGFIKKHQERGRSVHVTASSTQRMELTVVK